MRWRRGPTYSSSIFSLGWSRGLEDKADVWLVPAFGSEFFPNEGPNGGFVVEALGVLISPWKNFCCSDSLLKVLRMDARKAFICCICS